MSPTRRQVLMTSAGLVTAALMPTPTTATIELAADDRPGFIGVSLLEIGLQMSDGSSKILTLSNDTANGYGASGSFTDIHPVCQHHKEVIAPEVAEWAAMWIEGNVYGVLSALNEEGAITAW